MNLNQQIQMEHEQHYQKKSELINKNLNKNTIYLKGIRVAFYFSFSFECFFVCSLDAAKLDGFCGYFNGIGATRAQTFVQFMAKSWQMSNHGNYEFEWCV